MAVTEKQIEEKLKVLIFRLKGLYIKFTSPGFNGMPDRLIILPGGKLYFAELKKPKGGKLSPVQKTVHKLLERLGIKVFVLWTFEDLEDFINMIVLN